MRTIAIAVIALTLFGCSNKKNEQVTDTTTRVENFTDAQAVTKVASDKELLRQTLVEAAQRGTLAVGVSAAATDSLTNAKMREALLHPAVITPANDTKKSTTKGRTAASGTPAQKKDALDKANESLDKANQTVQKSGEVINKAQDIGKKAGEILNGRR